MCLRYSNKSVPPSHSPPPLLAFVLVRLVILDVALVRLVLLRHLVVRLEALRVEEDLVRVVQEVAIVPILVTRDPSAALVAAGVVGRERDAARARLRAAISDQCRSSRPARAPSRPPSPPLPQPPGS